MFLATASPGGLCGLSGPRELEELVACHLPAVGQTLADRLLEDGLAELQAGAYLGTSWDGLALPPSLASLDLEELLDLHHEGKGAGRGATLILGEERTDRGGGVMPTGPGAGGLLLSYQLPFFLINQLARKRNFLIKCY